jgi:hypothetical protein
MQNHAVTILFGSPEIIPHLPVTIVAEVNGKNAVEMGETFFGQKIERQRYTRRRTDSFRSLSQILQMAVGVFIRRRVQDFTWKPEHALRLVLLHQLGHCRLEISQYFDF